MVAPTSAEAATRAMAPRIRPRRRSNSRRIGPCPRALLGRCRSWLVTRNALPNDVWETMDRAAIPVGVEPQLGDGPHQAGCPVGHDEERAPKTPTGSASSLRCHQFYSGLRTPHPELPGPPVDRALAWRDLSPPDWLDFSTGAEAA